MLKNLAESELAPKEVSAEEAASAKQTLKAYEMQFAHNRIVEPEPFEDFPTDALPAVMQDMVKTIAKAQSLPEAFIAYPALSHVASAIGNSREAKCYPDGGTEPAILWTGIIADSGAGKTEVLRKLSYPLEVVERGYTAASKNRMNNINGT